MDFNTKKDLFLNEFNFLTSRSSGPGGQNVNKVNSQVELRFNVDDSELLSEIEKEKIKSYLKNKINNSGELIIQAQEHRSQYKNKQEAIDKFFMLTERALRPKKKRIPTKKSFASQQKRLNKKKQQSEKKHRRKNPDV